ncbi:MAG: sigma-54-dependent transcriptional regulator [Leptospirales bacterium]
MTLDSPNLPVNSPPIFIVDDDPVVVKQLYWLFKEEYQVLSACTFGDAVDLFLKEKPPVAILDLSLGREEHQNGIDLLRLFSEADPHFHGIILSGSIDRPQALEAVRLGAYDLLDKSIDPEELKRVVGRAYNRALLGRDTHKPRPEESEPQSDTPFSNIVTQSAKMKEMLRLLQKISTTDVSVLITGESGTGKELFARACHDRSLRKNGPFVAINCGAIPENLLESELFGHEKGAFTGATESRAGKFESANHGTIFLDEVAELHIELQVKLLRVLQDKIVERVGSRTGKQLDVRIIAATNQPLGELMAQGRFREDLFYRLSVMGFQLPPLREREGDVTVLAQHFLEKFKTEYQKHQLIDFSRETLDLIKRYDWPGNIRELENRIQRAVIVANGKWITPSDIDIEFQLGNAPAPSSFLNLQDAREDAEKKMLLEAFEQARGNISQVARIIGTSRPTVHALIKKHGLTPGHFKE